MKNCLCLRLIVCLLLVPFVSANAAENGEVETSLGEETAGDMRMSMTLDAYFSMRNDTFSGEAAVMAQCESTLAAVSANNELTAKNLQRLAAPKELAEYHSIHITDTSVSYQIESVTETEPSIYEVEVYEWTWVYYNDGRGGPVDKMGFGTDHAMVLRELDDGGYIIVEDDYDDSDIMGPHNHTITPSDEQEIDLEKVSTTQTNNFGVNYKALLNVEDLIKYANRYVFNFDNPYDKGVYPEYYNPEYACFVKNGIENDCVNYVSQCLMAGGMKNDYTSNLGWWYDRDPTSEDREHDSSSTSWRFVGDFYNYWIAQGFAYADAGNTTVLPGDAIICKTGERIFNHAAICVGFNFQKEPVLNAHTNDRYQMPLSVFTNYYYSVLVIQIAGHENEHNHLYVCKGDGVFYHKYTCSICGDSYTEKHEWVKENDYYVCSICSMTSSFIPIQPAGNLSGTPLTQETAEK